MSETFLTLRNGGRVGSAGEAYSEAGSIPVRLATVSYTGTQLQSGGTPIELVAAPGANRVIVPLAWHTAFDHAGGTNFSAEDDIDLTDSTDTARYGRAASAIAGGSDASALGNILTTTYAANQGMYIVTTNAGTSGNPTGGHAGATLIVTLLYYIGYSYL